MDSREMRTAELAELVETGVREVFTSRKYADWLAFSAKFPNYSINNQILMHKSMPNATYVMGYKGWQRFERNVMKGESGTAIYAPEIREAVNSNGEKSRYPAYYYRVFVFDVSQTDGKPLPMASKELTQRVDGYKRFLEALIKISPFKVEFMPLKEGNSYCDFKNGKIVIRAGMGQAQTAKALIHEITHTRLHAPVHRLDAVKSKRTKTLEAESAAYIVCSHYGIGASAYSFAYVAAWSRYKGTSELKASMERIKKHSTDLIKSIESGMAAIGPLEKAQPLASAQRAAESLPSAREAPTIMDMAGGSRPEAQSRLADAKARAAERNAPKPEASKPSGRERPEGRDGGGNSAHGSRLADAKARAAAANKQNKEASQSAQGQAGANKERQER